MTSATAAVDAATVIAVEQFLHREAHLLDQRRFQEWLELLTPDVRYWMPVLGDRGAEGWVAGPGDMAWFDDDRQSLELRVQRLSTGQAHAETPPSRTRRFIGSVLVEPGEREGELRVLSNVLVYRTRRERDLDMLAGNRQDVLREVNGGWKVAERRVILDQNILASQNLSIFF